MSTPGSPSGEPPTTQRRGHERRRPGPARAPLVLRTHEGGRAEVRRGAGLRPAGLLHRAAGSGDHRHRGQGADDRPRRAEDDGHGSGLQRRRALRRDRQRAVRSAVGPDHRPLFGRRRPWIVGGTIVMTVAFVIIALGQTVPVILPVGAWRSSARTRPWRRSSPPSPTRCRSSSAAACPPCWASRRTSASSAARISPRSSPTSW